LRLAKANRQKFFASFFQKRRPFFLLFAACIVCGSTAKAQAPTLSADQLDHLVAGIALYPDPLLSAVLAAATYPAEIVEAHRLLGASTLHGAALIAAAAQHPWDASVKALIAFPQVLALMDHDLEWTEALGRAVTLQQADVLNAIQRLRQEAQLTGHLANSPQVSVINEGAYIAINPPSPQEMFVPTYNSACITMPYPACAPADDSVAWAGVDLPYDYQPWAVFDWPGYVIRVNVGHFSGQRPVWHHAGLAAALHPVAVPDDGFAYAPPATTPFSSRTQDAHPFAAAPTIGHTTIHAPFVHAPIVRAPHPVAVVHPGIVSVPR
jgi:hypothetical protein